MTCPRQCNNGIFEEVDEFGSEITTYCNCNDGEAAFLEEFPEYDPESEQFVSEEVELTCNLLGCDNPLPENWPVEWCEDCNDQFREGLPAPKPGDPAKHNSFCMCDDCHPATN